MDLRAWLVERFKERRAWTVVELIERPDRPVGSISDIDKAAKELGAGESSVTAPCGSWTRVYAVMGLWQPPAAPPEAPAAREPEPEWVRVVRERDDAGDEVFVAIHDLNGHWVLWALGIGGKMRPLYSTDRKALLKVLANSL